MEPVRINVLESYDLKFCCVCIQNGDHSYLNVFENVISYQNVYISLAQIINETLGLNVPRNTNQPREICVSCKSKIVDFFIFKRRNEETRKICLIFGKPTSPVKNDLLQMVDQLDNLPLDSENLVKEELNFEEEILETADDIDDYCDVPEDETLDKPQEDKSLNEIETEQASNQKHIRRSNPESWKRNTRKLARNTGQSYVAANGKVIEAKQMRRNCGASCRMQCVKKINEQSRLENFKAFYSLADIEKQRKFLFEHMKTFQPRRNKISPSSKKSRAIQRNYFLDVTHPNGAKEMLQVCNLLFLNTFCISSQMIDTLHRKAITEGKFTDVRGKFERHNTKLQAMSNRDCKSLEFKECKISHEEA